MKPKLMWAIVKKETGEILEVHASRKTARQVSIKGVMIVKKAKVSIINN